MRNDTVSETSDSTTAGDSSDHTVAANDNAVDNVITSSMDPCDATTFENVFEQNVCLAEESKDEVTTITEHDNQIILKEMALVGSKNSRLRNSIFSKCSPRF